MAFSLSAKAQADLYRLESYELVDSTNNLAAEFAKSGDAGRLWIIAAQQTGGRGRRGRVWQSPAGNLYASLLLTGIDAEQTAELGFVAGVSLYEALKALLPRDLWQGGNFKLKWPNDMLADGAKLAGILPEFIRFPAKAAKPGHGPRPAEPGIQTAAIIGIGVNVGAAPDNLPPPPAENAAAENAPVYSAACLRGLGTECSAAEVFMALSETWLSNYALWSKGCGMNLIRRKWLDYAAGQGQPIHLICRGQRLDGIFETIDAKGRLVLREANGELHFISAGEVYFGTAASAKAES